ncbi:MAG: TauD/TfdA family dioxygenase, partial [Halieaceae bacterium]
MTVSADAPRHAAMITPAVFTLATRGSLESEQQAQVESLLNDHGFVLFRGFDIEDHHCFHQVVESFDYPNFRYADSFSNAVRTNRTERVFTANEAPPSVEIFLHHEMAQTLTFPSRGGLVLVPAGGTPGCTPQGG